jgi:hypothetical protein
LGAAQAGVGTRQFKIERRLPSERGNFFECRATAKLVASFLSPTPEGKNMAQTLYSLNGFWSSQRLTAEECAERFRSFVNELPSIDPIYETWLRMSPSKKPFCSVPISLDEARRLVEKGRLRAVVAERFSQEGGFHLGGRNVGPHPRDDVGPSDAMTEVRAGVCCPDVSQCNFIVMHLSRVRLTTGRPWRASEIRRLMRLVLRVWSPREISVDGGQHLYMAAKTEFINSIGQTRTRVLIPRIGWLTYLPADLAAKVRLPATVDVERLDDGGVVISICEDLFRSTTLITWREFGRSSTPCVRFNPDSSR